MRDERFKQREELPSRVQLILHLEQWIRSNAWLGNNNRCVANTATMAGTPRSRANWIWFSWKSFGATERVVTLRCIKKAPKLATPQPTSKATLVLWPNAISGTICTFNFKLARSIFSNKYQNEFEETNLRNLIQVFICTMYKLSSTTRKNKFILLYWYPILTAFILD